MLRASIKRVFAASVTETPVLLVAGEEPEADWNLGRVEKLSGQSDHAVHEVGFDDRLSNFPFTGLIRRHRTVGKDESR